jgi:hypothetical protein
MFSCRHPLTSSQLRVGSLEGFKSRTVAAEEQLQTSTGFDEPGGQIHQLLNHCLDPAPLGGVAHRACSFNESDLPDRAQDVVGQHHLTKNISLTAEEGRRDVRDLVRPQGAAVCANPADVRNRSITVRTKAGELTSARHFEKFLYLYMLTDESQPICEGLQIKC